MTDIFTKEQRSRIMSKIRYKDTKPELKLRHFLYNRGYRYRVNYGPEKIDIAFPKFQNSNLYRRMLLAWLPKTFTYAENQ